MATSEENTPVYDIDDAIRVVYENISEEIKSKYSIDQIREVLETTQNFLEDQDSNTKVENSASSDENWDVLVNDVLFDLNNRELLFTKEEVDEILDAEIIYLEQIGVIEDPDSDEGIMSWWKSLDTSWKNIFKQNLDITHSPNFTEIKQILNLRAINCSGKRILSLEPLGRLNGLEFIDCSKTKINSLKNISDHTNLIEINVSSTGITDLSPLSGMGKLVKLTCNNTEINDLSPLIGLMSLKYVDLSYTKVKNLEPLGQLSKLQNVNCDNSLVEDIDPIRFVPVISYNETGVYYSKIDHSEKDEFFEEAARLVVQHQHGSTSLIQRKLKIGFNRAGRLIDQLEMEGIVSSFNGESSRDVNIKDIYTLERFFSSTYNNYLEFKRTEEVIQARLQKNHFENNQSKESNILRQDYPFVQDNSSESMDDLQPETTLPQYSEPSKTVPRWISFILLTTIIIVTILIYQKCK